MSLGPVMVDLKGTELAQDESEMLRHPLVGGVILFSRNFESAEQIQQLIAAIHSVRQPRLLVAVDQEGGRVQRFREGFTRLPAVRKLGELYDRDRKRALSCAETTGWLMASELLAVGVDISFAPVLDLDRGVSTVIGDRAFHSDPEVVAELAHAYMIGMRKAGMAATGKHFPGHGSVEADSHVALPVDRRRFADLQAADILPFERMIHFGIAGMMVAHVVYPAVDERPAGFSQRWLEEILRKQLGFQGAIFSDDLSMVGAECMGDHCERARAALNAGSDMVLVCNQPHARDQVLAGLADLDNPVSHLRLARMHGRPAFTHTELQQSQVWKHAVETLRVYDTDPLLDMDM